MCEGGCGCVFDVDVSMCVCGGRKGGRGERVLYMCFFSMSCLTDELPCFAVFVSPHITK